MITFKLNPEKTVEVAAMFLKLHKGQMKYLGLMKLLYMADRIALERIEQPISGDSYVSMDYGPVLSTAYDLIKGKASNDVQQVWSKYISTHNGDKIVKLINDPGKAELCEEEEEIIQEVYNNCGHIDRFDLAEITHSFPEWQDPHGTSIPIRVENILKNVGKNEEEIEWIRQETERQKYLDGILNG